MEQNKGNNLVISEYERKNILKRFINWVKDTFSNKGKDLLNNDNMIDKYIDEEATKMLKVREEVFPISEQDKAKLKSEFQMTLEGLVKEKDEMAFQQADEEKTKSEKDKEINDKKSTVKTEKSTKVRDANNKELGYLDRVELLNQMKVKLVREQLRKGEYVPSDKEYYKMLLLQKSIEKDRGAFIEGLDEESKTELIKLEEEFRKKELDLERKSNKKFREECAELSELNTKLREINDWIEFKQEEMREGKVDSAEYEKQMAGKQLELEETLAKISALNPEKLQEAMDKKAKHNRLEKCVMGRDYREKVYLRSSDEMKERLDYKTGKEKEQTYTIIKENKILQHEGIEKTMEHCEKHKEKLEKELETMPDTPENLERRAEVIKELRITDAKLDNYEDTKKVLEQGMQKDENVEYKITDESKELEQDIKEIEKDFDKIEDKIEENNKQLGEQVLKSEMTKEAEMTAATVAAAVIIADDCPHDIEHGIVAGAVAGAIVEEENKGRINEWASQVNDGYDEKAVEQKAARDAKLREELNEQEYTLERTRKD